MLDEYGIWFILGSPLLGFLINGFFGHKIGKPGAGIIASVAVGLSFLITLLVMWPIVQKLPPRGFQDFTLYEWLGQDPTVITTGPALSIPFAVRVDPLSTSMVTLVTGVGFLIHVYSIGYMADEPRSGRFFTFMNLFALAMLILVMANNYLLLFVGWEGVGLCSYLLIGFFFEKESAAAAAKKAMLVNRVGDYGFILGLIWMFAVFGTLTYSTPSGRGVFDQVVADPVKFHAGAFALTGITLLLVAGVCGKSAQFPLYVWLPDAMEGPTPVSALIHAATMVTAGVYVIARSAALFSRAPVSEAVVAGIGAFTAIFAALVAIVQYDIKKVLAWSTISQLGYMVLGVGVGAYAAGMFHLYTHAFFKALLFLAAGSVMHGMAGELDLRHMGGLAKVMRYTFWTFAIGWLAIAGLPPLAGYYSKDAILSSTMDRFPVLSWIGLLAAGLTAFYMSRLFLTVFLGEPRWHADDRHHGDADAQRAATAGGHGDAHRGHAEDHGHHWHGPHESPWVMVGPLFILAALSIVGGIWLGGSVLPKHDTALGHFLEPSFRQAMPHAAHHAGAASVVPWLSIVVAALGIVAGWQLHKQGVFARGWGNAAWARMLEARFGWDALLHGLFVRGGQIASDLLYAVVDTLMIDNIVDGVGKSTERAAQGLRQLQTGFVRNYALVLFTGAVFVVITLMFTWRWGQ